MRLTKGMKKVLSMTLAAALVVTGVSLPQKASKADTPAETIPTYTVTTGGAIQIDFTVTGTNTSEVITAIDDKAESWNAGDVAGNNVTTSKGDGAYQIKYNVDKTLTYDSTNGCFGLQAKTILKSTTTFKISNVTLKIGDATVALKSDIDSQKDTSDSKYRYMFYNAWSTPAVNWFAAPSTETSTAPTSGSDAASGSSAAPASTATGSSAAPATGSSAAPATGSSAAPTATPTEAPAPTPHTTYPFTARFENYGNINGWNGDPNDEGSTVTVEKEGTYTIKTKQTTDMDDMKTAGCLALGTDLVGKPDGFNIIGKTIKVGSKSYDLDPVTAQAYSDNGAVRVGIANEWNGYPWANTIVSTGAVPVKAGDEVAITFEVKAGALAGFWDNNDEGEEWVAQEKAKLATPTPGAKASTTPKKTATPKPAAKNPCKKVKAAKKSVTVKRGKSKKLTFKLTNTTKSQATTDKITVKSSKKKYVTAKIKSKKATKKYQKVVVQIKVKKKAKKKAKVKITLKAGKKSAKTTVKIK